MRIGVIMYDWEWVEFESDSILRVIYEAAKRGHEIFCINKDTIDNAQDVAVNRLLYSNQESLKSFFQSVSFETEQLRFEDLDYMIYSDVPPLNDVLLDLLAQIESQVPFFNPVTALQKIRRKDYLKDAYFDAFVPKTDYYQLEELESIHFEGKKVFKPMQGYKGEGVCLVDEQALQSKTEKEFLLQEYLPGVQKGSVRVLWLNGHVLGAFIRIPEQGSLNTNIAEGGRHVEYEISERENEILDQITPKLIDDAIQYAGIDFIDQQLIEVNGLAPGGIARLFHLNGLQIEKRIVDFIESKTT